MAISTPEAALLRQVAHAGLLDIDDRGDPAAEQADRLERAGYLRSVKDQANGRRRAVLSGVGISAVRSLAHIA